MAEGEKPKPHKRFGMPKPKAPSSQGELAYLYDPAFLKKIEAQAKKDAADPAKVLDHELNCYCDPLMKEGISTLVKRYGIEDALEQLMIVAEIQGDDVICRENRLSSFIHEYRFRLTAIAKGLRSTVIDIPDDAVRGENLEIYEALARAALTTVFAEKTGADGQQLARRFLEDVKNDMKAIFRAHMGPLPPEVG